MLSGYQPGDFLKNVDVPDEDESGEDQALPAEDDQRKVAERAEDAVENAIEVRAVQSTESYRMLQKKRPFFLDMSTVMLNSLLAFFALPSC